MMNDASSQAARQTSGPAPSSDVPSSQRRGPASRTKAALCDTLERLSKDGAPDHEKRDEILPALYRHAVALAEESAASLPQVARDELVSTLGERAALGLGKLDLKAPPAQQAAYLDRVLHHALADACRAVDPLGRGPRTLRKRYEDLVEERAKQDGSMPAPSERSRILDEVASKCRPILKLIVSSGMSPEEAVTHSVRPTTPEWCGDPADTVSVAAARRQIARAIAEHPDQAVREYLFEVAAGMKAREPADFHRRLGPTLPALIASLAM